MATYTNLSKKFLHLLCFFAWFFLQLKINALEEQLEVISKSQTHRPQWFDQQNKINSEWKDKRNLIYLKSQIKNLALGIKQAQTAAKNLAPMLTIEMILKNSDSFKSYSLQNRQCLEHILFNNQNFQKWIVSTPIPQDIYWEEYKDNSNSNVFYNVWVLLLIQEKETIHLEDAIEKYIHHKSDKLNGGCL